MALADAPLRSDFKKLATVALIWINRRLPRLTYFAQGRFARLTEDKEK